MEDWGEEPPDAAMDVASNEPRKVTTHESNLINCAPCQHLQNRYSPVSSSGGENPDRSRLP
jgi:hypothetical protein